LTAPIWYKNIVNSEKCKKNKKYLADNYQNLFQENFETKNSTINKLDEIWKKFDKPKERKLKP